MLTNIPASALTSAGANQDLHMDATGAAIIGGMRREYVTADAALGNPSTIGTAFAVVSGGTYRYRLRALTTQATGSLTLNCGLFAVVSATVSRHTRAVHAVHGGQPAENALSDTSLTTTLTCAFNAAVIEIDLEGSFICTASGTVQAKLGEATGACTLLAGSHFEIERVA